MSMRGLVKPGLTRSGRRIKITAKAKACLLEPHKKALGTAIEDADAVGNKINNALKEQQEIETLRSIAQEWEECFEQVGTLYSDLENYTEGEELSGIQEGFKEKLDEFNEIDNRLTTQLVELDPPKENSHVDTKGPDHPEVKKESALTQSIREMEAKLQESMKQLEVAKARLLHEDKENNTEDVSKTMKTEKASDVQTDNDSYVGRLLERMDERSLRSELPKVVPRQFKGDLLQFSTWWSSFQTAVENKTSCSRERLLHLLQCTEGPVKSLVEMYMPHENQDEAYRSVKAQLFYRYGHPMKIADAYKAKLHNWNKIRNGDGEELQRYADFLYQCLIGMKSLSYLSNLDSQEENIAMAKKLPDPLQIKWCRKIDKSMYPNGGDIVPDLSSADMRYPSFNEFCKFVMEEARIATGPYALLREQMKESTNKKAQALATSIPRDRGNTKPSTSGETPRTKSSLNGRSYVEFKPGRTEHSAEQGTGRCCFCQADHHLYQCTSFLENTTEYKKTYAMKRGLCFGCLRRGHRAWECTINNRTLMKDGSKPTQARVNTTRTPSDRHTSESQYSMVLPVWIYPDDNEEHRFLTYAALDTQADGTFITQKLADKLGVEQKKTKVDLITMGTRKSIDTTRVENLKIVGQWEEEEVNVRRCYTRKYIPVSTDSVATHEEVKRWRHLTPLVRLMPDKNPDLEVEILVGTNCPRAFRPDGTMNSRDTDMFAVHTTLGWSVIGTPEANEGEVLMRHCFNTKVREVTQPDIVDAFGLDFVEGAKDYEKCSAEDELFLKIIREGIEHLPNGHFQMPLPMKEVPSDLPDSRPHASCCLDSVGKKMKKDRDYAKKYTTSMEKLIANEEKAEPVPPDDTTPVSETWYWSHHGVNHLLKPDVIRSVFNGSKKIRGVALNDLLLTGPDMTNNLVGVLLAFRLYLIGILCDVEGMFHQVLVTPWFRNFLRFFWFRDSDPDKEKLTYRMKVHLFGASSSPGCANYALKETARRFGDKYGKKAVEFIQDHFYVDDGLGGADERQEATELIKNSHGLCKEGGFNLCKFVTTDEEVNKTIPPAIAAPKRDSVRLAELPQKPDKTLGVGILLDIDCFIYHLDLQEYKATRRSLLSRLSAVYDPMGLICAVLLPGRNILKSLCNQKFDWDDKLPDTVMKVWKGWYEDLSALTELRIPRCIRVVGQHDLKYTLLVTFSDASDDGHGALCYYVQVDKTGVGHPRLVYGKARVNPMKAVTIPRLELQAGVLGVKMSNFAGEYLAVAEERAYYYSDSTPALGYIQNEHKRFQKYVVNRGSFIRAHSRKEHWNYVATEDNPADMASRGATASEIVNCKLWWEGPEWLKTPEVIKPNQKKYVIREDDPEITKEQKCMATKVGPKPWFFEMLEKHSSFRKSNEIMYYVMKFIDRCRGLEENDRSTRERARNYMIREAQKYVLPETYQFYKEERKTHRTQEIRENENETNQGTEKTQKHTRRQTHLSGLTPFVDRFGVLRVGGRVRRAEFHTGGYHPVILPKDNIVTRRIVEDIHHGIKHQSANWTHSAIRQRGLWVLGGRREVNHYVMRCVTCRRYRGSPRSPPMGEMPKERITPEAPFTNTASDIFGPFSVKVARSQRKRWICLFVCMVSRAVHLEVVESLDVSGFINAYRRFLGRRGPICKLWSDRGTNYIGTDSEMRKIREEMERDPDTWKNQLDVRGRDWLNITFGIPKASHMGGSWERMVRTVRGALNHTLQTHGDSLTDEILRTAVVESESLVNSRPLSYIENNNGDDPLPLSPATLLTLKLDMVAPLPGKFEKADKWSKKRWRFVQFLAEQFWFRWKREVFAELTPRKKWTKAERNLEVNDVVFVTTEETARGRWPLGRVTQTYPGEDGIVRKVQIRMKGGLFDRPVHKLVLALEADGDYG